MTLSEAVLSNLPGNFMSGRLSNSPGESGVFISCEAG